MNIISGCPEVNNTEDFYKKADEYWREVPSTVDGMLGGFPHVSNIDANGSRKFLKAFIQVRECVFCGITMLYFLLKTFHWIKKDLILLLLLKHL